MAGCDDFLKYVNRAKLSLEKEKFPTLRIKEVKKIRALICSMKYLSPEVALFPYKLPSDHAWNTVAMSGLMPLVATWNC